MGTAVLGLTNATGAAEEPPGRSRELATRLQGLRGPQGESMPELLHQLGAGT